MSACFTYTLLSRLIFPHTCPRPRPVTVLIKGVERVVPLLVSLVTTPSPLHLYMYIEQWRLPPCLTHQLPHTVRGHSRTLLQTRKLPYPLDHWCLLLLPLPLSLVLKLGEYRSCRPVGCSPTVGKRSCFKKSPGWKKKICLKTMQNIKDW